MVRRLGFAVAGALALLMAVSGLTAAATPFQVTILKQECSYHGGAQGGGWVLLRIKVREVGTSGANYFVIKSKVLEALAGGNKPYGTAYTWPKETSSNFADDSVNHYRIVERRWEPDFVDGKIRMTVQFVSNTQGVVKTVVVDGAYC